MNKAIKTFIVCVLLITMCHPSEDKRFENNDIIKNNWECTLGGIVISEGTLFRVIAKLQDEKIKIEGADINNELRTMTIDNENLCRAFWKLKEDDFIVAKKDCTLDGITIKAGTLRRVITLSSDGSMIIIGASSGRMTISNEDAIARFSILKTGDIVSFNGSNGTTMLETFEVADLFYFDRMRFDKPVIVEHGERVTRHHVELDEILLFSVLQRGDVLRVKTNEGCTLPVRLDGIKTDPKKRFQKDEMFQVYNDKIGGPFIVEVTHVDYYGQHTFLYVEHVCGNFRKVNDFFDGHNHLVMITKAFRGFKPGQICWSNDVSDKMRGNFVRLEKGKVISRFQKHSSHSSHPSAAASSLPLTFIMGFTIAIVMVIN